MFVKFALIVSSALMGSAVADESVFTLGEPKILGSGCPAHSVEIVQAVDEDNNTANTVSVLFSEYEAITSYGVKRVRKTCNLAVPVTVKPGISIGVFKVDYRGYSYVPEDSSGRTYSRFDAEYYFAGWRGKRVRRRYAGRSKEIDRDLYISDEVGVGAVVWSECGKSTNFRINTAITASKADPYSYDDVEIYIDSMDTTTKDEHYFKYYVIYEECDEDKH